jgi:hypothetical protein
MISMPVYDQVRTVRETLRRLDAADATGPEKELITGDDGPADGTRELSRALEAALVDADLRVERGRRGRKPVRQDDLERVADTYRALDERLLTGSVGLTDKMRRSFRVADPGAFPSGT